jgi:hypothetical protein
MARRPTDNDRLAHGAASGTAAAKVNEATAAVGKMAQTKTAAAIATARAAGRPNPPPTSRPTGRCHHHRKRKLRRRIKPKQTATKLPAWRRTLFLASCAAPCAICVNLRAHGQFAKTIDRSCYFAQGRRPGEVSFRRFSGRWIEVGTDRPNPSRRKRGHFALLHREKSDMSLEMLHTVMTITFACVCLFIGRILTRQPVRTRR